MSDFSAIRSRLAGAPPARVEAPGADLAAVSVILSPAPGGLELLLIKRAEHPQDPWSGQMGLPGGRREPGDADLAATARRETLEETGVSLPERALLGELDDLRPLSRPLPRIVVRPFVFGLSRRPATRASAEVAGCYWVGLSELKAGAGLARVAVRGRSLEVSAFTVGPLVVWGLTERILAQLLGLL